MMKLKINFNLRTFFHEFNSFHKQKCINKHIGYEVFFGLLRKKWSFIILKYIHANYIMIKRIETWHLKTVFCIFKIVSISYADFVIVLLSTICHAYIKHSVGEHRNYFIASHTSSHKFILCNDIIFKIIHLLKSYFCHSIGI